MAAIDKLYIDNYEQYCQFRDWCKEQPPFKDKYGYETSLIDYLWYKDETFEGGPIMRSEEFTDAILARTCPFDFIQDELKLRYGGFYSQFKNGQVYTSPGEIIPKEIGHHCKIIKIPDLYRGHKCNRPIKGRWIVEIDDNLNYLRYNRYIDKKRKPTWDYHDDFISGVDWSSNSAGGFKTLKSVIRHIRKWNLPIGTRLRVWGRYVGEDYIIKVTK